MVTTYRGDVCIALPPLLWQVRRSSDVSRLEVDLLGVALDGAIIRLTAKTPDMLNWLLLRVPASRVSASAEAKSLTKVSVHG